MKVKVGDKIFDGRDEPIMVILTEQDRKNIATMKPDMTRYAVFPTEKMTSEEMIEWMEEI